MTATNSTVNVHNSVFQYNTAYWYGGVIYSDIRSVMQYRTTYTNITIENSIFTNNRVRYYNGGVIYIYDYQYSSRSLASTQHTHSTNMESFSEHFSTSTLKASLITTTHYNMEASTTMLPTPSLIEAMPTQISQHSEQLSLFSSTDYLTSLEPETSSDFSLSSLTQSRTSMLNTYLDPSLPQSGAVTSLSTTKYWQCNSAVQDRYRAGGSKF